MVHEFQLAGQRVRLWQKTGETYRHILLKALGYALFAPTFPTLTIETPVGLRYRPDLIARDAAGNFLLWGECGLNSLRKTAWLLKHTDLKQFVLLKHDFSNLDMLAAQLQKAVAARYRPPPRLVLINFVAEIETLAASREIAVVPAHWYTRQVI